MSSRRRFLSGLVGALPHAPMMSAGEAGQADELKSWDLDYLSAGTILTPNDRFFLRNHFGPPILDVTSTRLSVGGHVRGAFEINWRELAKRRRRVVTATLECAGNTVGGTAVSTAAWAGVSLGDLLNEARPRPGVRFVRLVGADHGLVNASPNRPAPYMRSIPLDAALRPDTILAFEMNDAPLGVEHGSPLRAIVPGRYGMDSVKWVVAIEALERGDTSYFMTERYVTARLLPTGAERIAVGRMLVKSHIIQPRDEERLGAGPYTVKGVAWAGDREVSKVEVSFDAGKNWVPARLEARPSAYTWVLWRCSWTPPGAGGYTIMARATDVEGRTQPALRDRFRFDQYENNWYHAVRCMVAGS